MSSLGNNLQRPHALVIPLSGQGHWNPMKALLRQMVDYGISFTVLSSPVRIAELQELKLSGEFGNLDVELITVFPDTPPGSITASFLVTEMRNQFDEALIMEKLAAQKASNSGPTFIVADMFLYWTQDIAEQLEIPRYLFFTSPCFYCLLFLHTATILDNGWYPTTPDPSKLDEAVNIPGLEIFRARDLPVQLYDVRIFYDLHRKFSTKAAGFLVNSFELFEGKMVSTLRSELQNVVSNGKVPKVLLIGPVARLWTFPSKSGTDAFGQEQEKCFRFLDSKYASSVVYICFGSQFQPSPSALTELARGLELTDVPFLWILPPRKDLGSSTSGSELEFLPAGFQTRVQGRGLVWQGWAPQKAILDHRSVGGFVSHCGWNSLQEAILGGVPIIAWPLSAEQAMNARLIVRDARVGIQITGNVDDEIVSGKVADAIRLLTASATGDGVRTNMKELSKGAVASVREGGSSHQDLNTFLQDVTNPRI